MTEETEAPVARSEWADLSDDELANRLYEKRPRNLSEAHVQEIIISLVEGRDDPDVAKKIDRIWNDLQ